MGPSIGKKLSLFVALVVAASVAAMGTLAYQMMEAKFAEVLRKDTLDTATLLASRVRNELRHIAERARVLAGAALEEFKNPDDQIRFLEENMTIDDQIIAMSMFRRSSATRGRWSPVFRLTRPEGDAAHLEDGEFDELDLKYPLDFNLVSEGAVEINVGKLRDHSPILRLAVPIAKKKDGHFTQLLSLEVRQERLTGAFAEATSHFSFILDRKGRVLTQTDPTHFTFGEDLSNLPILQMAHSTDAPNGNLDYYELPGSSLQYGSFHKVGYADLMVVTQAPRALIVQTLRTFTRRAINLALACVALATALALLACWGIVSLRLSRIAQAFRRIGDGKFGVLFPEQNADDEIGDFARRLQTVCDELKDRDKVHGTFAKLKSRRFRSKIDEGKVNFKGERQKAMALHCHLYGLDEVVAKADPEMLLRFLNEFNESISKAVESQHGVVDHVQGGSMTAFWGIPVPDRNDADHTLTAALEVRKAAKHLNTSLKEHHLPKITLAVGIHYGTVLTGQVGTADRSEYTALGEAVETALRIQTFADQFGTDILVTGQAATLAPAWFSLENVAPADEKNPELFELMGKAKQAIKASAQKVEDESDESEGPVLKSVGNIKSPSTSSKSASAGSPVVPEATTKKKRGSASEAA